MPSIFPRISSTQKKGLSKKVVPALAIVVIIILIAVLIRYGIDLERFKGYGYLGVFLVTLISNSTIVFPVPGIAVVASIAAISDPFWVGVVASIGSALGELTGYGLGRWGRAAIGEKYLQKHQRVELWMKRYGTLTIFVFALVPFVVFDLVGIVAGSLRFPLWKFLIACWGGRLIRYLIVAYGGWSLLRFLFPGTF